jgi:hypothetical protein
MRYCAICNAELRPTNRTACCAECRLTARNGAFEDEVWLPVVGHIGFEISDRGHIRDARTKATVPPDRSGRYPRVSLAGKRRAIHSLMAETWLGPRPWGARLVRHLDDDPTHCAITNISYGDHADNAADAKRNRATQTTAGMAPGRERKS